MASRIFVKSLTLGSSALALSFMCSPSVRAQASSPTDATPRASTEQPATATQPTAPAGASSSQTVTITGKRADVSDQIDRRVYNIKDDPSAQTGTAGDVLAKLPSVTISPAGKAELRGDPNVTILVDGKYPINEKNILQSLSAADIDRIEIMTNPSAEYAPDGTAGMINIITKRRHPLGLSGTIASRTDSLGQHGADVSTTLTTGPWSVTGQLHANHYDSPIDNYISRTLPDTAQENFLRMLPNDTVGAEGQVQYKLDDRQTLSADAQKMVGWSLRPAEASYRSSTINYNEQATDFQYDDIRYFDATYRFNDDKSGNHLTLDASHIDFTTTNRDHTVVSYDPSNAGASDYSAHLSKAAPTSELQVDFEHHDANGTHLTAGLDWTSSGRNEFDTYTDIGSVPGPFANGYTQAFDGTRTITAGYVTFQTLPIFGWTILPGLRLEQSQTRITGSAPLDLTENTAYPSLHLSHALGAGKLKLSYSRRVDRPDLMEYDPVVKYENSHTAYQGTPDLKTPLTDSYEASYDFTQKSVSYDADLYYHDQHDAISYFTADTGNGSTLSRYVNSGAARSGGLELTLKAPLLPHLKYSLDGNLYYNEIASFDGTTNDRKSDVTYSGNGMLEYDPDNGDQLQTTFAVTGRRLTVQGYFKPTAHLDATYRHPLTKKLALVVTATDIFKGMRQSLVVDTPILKYRSVTPAFDQSLRVALSYSFGGPKK